MVTNWVGYSLLGYFNKIWALIQPNSTNVYDALLSTSAFESHRVFRWSPCEMKGSRTIKKHWRQKGFEYSSQGKAGMRFASDHKLFGRNLLPTECNHVTGNSFVSFFWDRVSLHSPGWPQTQRFTCICLPRAGIQGLLPPCPLKFWAQLPVPRTMPTAGK